MTSVKPGAGLDKAQGPTLGEVDTLACVYCRASVHFVGLPATRYVEHLFKEHNILYDVEYVVQRTLSLKNGESQEKPKAADIGVQVNFDSYPVAFYKNRPIDKELIVKLKREEFQVDPECIKKEEQAPNISSNNINENNENIRFKEVKKKLPWYAGCEYVCRECDELYFYSEDIRKHIKEKHGDPDEYLDKHDKFETKAVVMPCLECSKNIKRHFNSILMHLRNHHQGMTMEEYQKKFKIPAKYEVVIKVKDKTLIEQKTHGVKRRAHIDPNLPKKVTRSRSHLSSSEEEKGKLDGCSSDKTDVSEATSTMSETDDEEESKNDKNQSHRSITSDCALTSDDISPEEISKSDEEVYNNKKENETSVNLIELELGNKSVPTIELEKELPLSSESILVPSLIENKRISNLETPWYSNGCEYVCQECNTLFDDYQKLATHLKSAHAHIPIKNYFKKYRNSCVKATFYTCKLCKVKLKLQLSTLRKHLKKAHLKTIKDYTAEYHPNDTTDSDCDGVDIFIDDDLQSEHLDNKLYLEWIKGSCEYRCQICGDEFKISSKLWTHVKKAHSKTVNEYKTEFGNSSFLTLSNTMECHGCFKVIRHDTAHIRRHAKLSHGMSSKAFFITLCKVKELNDGVYITEPINKSRNKEGSSINDDNHIREGYLQWVNRCIYTCHLCQQDFLGDMGLYNHVRANHDKNFTAYKEKFGSSMSKKVVFDCPLCHAQILHNLKHLTAHIKLHNNMKLFDFYSQYIARKASNLSQTVEKDRKCVKNTTDEECEVSENSVQYANFDEWANASKYGCKICNQFECTNCIPLISHLKKVHQFSKSKYTSKHGSLIIKKIMHKCRLCSTYVQQSYNILYNHLNKEHGMNVHEYYTLHVNPPASVRNESDNKNDFKSIVTTAKKEVEVKKKVETMIDKREDIVNCAETSNGFDLWANSCTFQCKICSWKTNMKSHLISHIKEMHEMDIQSYKKNFGSGFLTKTYHTCGICQMKVLCCVEMLTLHLKAHGMSPFQYYETYVAKPSHSFNHSSQVTNQSSFGIASEDNIIRRKDLDVSTPQENMFTNRFNRKEAALSWSSGCTYQCQICNRVYNKSNSFYLHLKVSHNTFTEEYRARFGSFRTSTAFHECLICKNKIIHTTNLLRNHLKTHNMSLTDYYWEYVCGSSSHLQKDGSQYNEDNSVTTSPNPENLIQSMLESCTYTPPQNIEQSPSELSYTKTINPQSIMNLLSNVSPILPKQDNPATKTAPVGLVAPNVPIIETVMQWASQCIYNCKICGKDYNRSNSFYLHLRMCHSTTPDEYRHQYKALRSLTVYHACLICGSNLVQTPCLMRKHFKSHGCSLQDYYIKYIQNSQVPSQIVPTKIEPKPVLKTNEKVVAPANKPGFIQPMPEMNTETSSHDEAALAWANKYASACHICKQSYSRNSNLLKHIRVVHKMEVARYREQYGINPPIIYHECNICHNPCAHTYKGLSEHLDLHDITLVTYHQKYIALGFNPLSNRNSKANNAPVSFHNSSFNSTIVPNASKPPQQMEIVEQQLHKTKSMELQSQSTTNADAFSIWKDACLYGCKMCNYSTKLRRFMMEHIKSVHNTSTSTYLHQFGTLESKAKYHNCVLCQSPILQDSITLHTHMFHSHKKMTVKEYYDKFVGKNISQSKSVIINDSEDGRSVNSEEENIGMHQQHSTEDAWSWANQCVYGCKICGKTFQQGNSFYKHIKVSHGETTASYLAKYQSLRSSTKMHNCQICGKSILQTAEHLKFHLRTHDNLSLEEYHHQYIRQGAAPVAEPSISYEDSEASISMKRSEAVPEDVFEEDLVVESDDDYNDSNSDDNEDDPVDKWMNQCMFRCKLCKSQVSSKLEFCQHVMDQHNTNFDDYSDFYGNPMIILKRHSCLICKTAVPFDAEEIQTHLYKHHSMLPHQYYYSHVANQNEQEPYKEEAQKEVLNVKGLKSISITRIAKPSVSKQKNLNQPSSSSTLVTKVPNPLLKPIVSSSNDNCNFEWNQCYECCKLCNEKYVNFDGTIYLHINKVHKSELSKNYHMSDYIEKKIIYHTCFVCDTDLEFRKTEIVRHLKTNHSASITDYEMQFKDELEDIFEHLNSNEDDENLEYPPEYLCDDSNTNETTYSMDGINDSCFITTNTQLKDKPNSKANKSLSSQHLISSSSFSQQESFSTEGEEVEGGIRIKVELDSSNEDEDEIDIDEFDINKI